MNEQSSWANRVGSAKQGKGGLPPESLPLFQERVDHAGLDALARSFSPKRWPTLEDSVEGQKSEQAFGKTLLIRQMQECLHRAPSTIRALPEFVEAQALVKEFAAYSSEVHTMTHSARKDWSRLFQEKFEQLAKKVTPLCGYQQVREAYGQDNERSDGGIYPLWASLTELPRQLESADAIGKLDKIADALFAICKIDNDLARSEAYGRWMHHAEPLRDFIKKHSDKSQGRDLSVLESMDSYLHRAKPMGLLHTAMSLKQIKSNAEQKLYTPDPLGEHCLVKAYREDRKGCKVLKIPPFKFDTADARNSNVMNVVFAARWGALAERIAGTALADSMNINNPTISTKYATKEVDDLMKHCGLTEKAPSVVASQTGIRSA